MVVETRRAMEQQLVGLIAISLDVLVVLMDFNLQKDNATVTWIRIALNYSLIAMQIILLNPLLAHFFLNFCKNSNHFIIYLNIRKLNSIIFRSQQTSTNAYLNRADLKRSA